MEKRTCTDFVIMVLIENIMFYDIRIVVAIGLV